MSSRGATHRGTKKSKGRRYYKPNHFSVPQRSRKRDDVAAAELDTSSMSYDELQYHVAQCRGKIAHKSYGAAYQAKKASEEDHPDAKFSIYRCPICGKFHLTTHPWEGFK